MDLRPLPPQGSASTGSAILAGQCGNISRRRMWKILQEAFSFSTIL